MRRIGFAVVLALSLALTPLVTHAQQRSAMPVLGILHSTSPSLLGSTFLQGLREEGYVEGQNIRIEYRSPEGAYERLPALSAELVALRVTAILALGAHAAHHPRGRPRETGQYFFRPGAPRSGSQPLETGATTIRGTWPD